MRVFAWWVKFWKEKKIQKKSNSTTKSEEETKTNNSNNQWISQSSTESSKMRMNETAIYLYLYPVHVLVGCCHSLCSQNPRIHSLEYRILDFCIVHNCSSAFFLWWFVVMNDILRLLLNHTVDPKDFAYWVFAKHTVWPKFNMFVVFC